MSDAILDEVVAGPGISWGVSLRNAETGGVLVAHDADRVLRTASIGKLLLLAEIARGLGIGEYAADELLNRDSVPPVADSGLWRHLRAAELSLHDAAVLIGAVSDNLATNVALRRVGLQSVTGLAGQLGLTGFGLHDVVRDVRGPGDPATLSTAPASELTTFFCRLYRGEVVDPRTSEQVLRWLAAGTDLSMAASAFGLDPLAHDAPDRGLRLWNKTGTDTGVRADAGVVVGPAGAVAYAFLAEWDGDEGRRDAVLAGMRALGGMLRQRVA